MHWYVQKEDFLQALGTVTSVVGPRSTIPVLQHILLEAQGEELRLVATDLEVSVETRLCLEGQAQGALSVPGRKLLSIVRELPSSTVELGLETNQKLLLKAETACYRLVGLPREEFPTFRRLEEGTRCEIPQGVFRRLLRRTAYAMSHDETRYVLNGVFLSIQRDEITAAATDGRRLAVMEERLDHEVPTPAEAIIPAKAIRELERQLAAKEGRVGIWIDRSQAGFELGEKTFLQCKLIEGKYPDFRTVIPPQTTKVAVVETQGILHAVHRASLLGADRPCSVFLRFREKELEVSCVVPDVGEATEYLPADYVGQEFTIAFNAQYLLDPLREIEGESVRMEMTDPYSACLIREVGTPQGVGAFLYVLMPVRLSQVSGKREQGDPAG
ncbi:DNA polymerase III subunit beta [Candidatus Methylacidithermus pantelleriae]|uniref:Beta sliding clamp n=1 Tax=Candidatus Methylacidithermus pantelleriae TaxID=2744239 RepID=A0A8J2FN28_9BACT|nr:DNA polymerase III subunit beta [Candidatus Methylacidithermus pantelleriae]CAF0689350.1 Beta sliding clamp [Candidatus Methylacidithermus pantelleriae]